MLRIPRKPWFDFTYVIIDHGRAICVARTPRCAERPVEPGVIAALAGTDGRQGAPAATSGARGVVLVQPAPPRCVLRRHERPLEAATGHPSTYGLLRRSGNVTRDGGPMGKNSSGSPDASRPGGADPMQRPGSGSRRPSFNHATVRRGSLAVRETPSQMRTGTEASVVSERRFSQEAERLVVAHRGASAYEARALAVAAGADVVEFDVRMTARGRHDDLMFDRTTDGAGLVRDLHLAEDQRLRIGTADGGQTEVPTLEEALIWPLGPGRRRRRDQEHPGEPDFDGSRELAVEATLRALLEMVGFGTALHLAVVHRTGSGTVPRGTAADDRGRGRAALGFAHGQGHGGCCRSPARSWPRFLARTGHDDLGCAGRHYAPPCGGG